MKTYICSVLLVRFYNSSENSNTRTRSNGTKIRVAAQLQELQKHVCAKTKISNQISNSFAIINTDQRDLDTIMSIDSR